MQFKAPVITSKAIYDIGSGYLKDHLSFIISAILYDQAVSKLQVPSIEQCYLMGPRKHAFL